MVDVRAIAYMIPCGRPRGPAERDQVTPSLIMINGVPQCPGRDIITTTPTSKGWTAPKSFGGPSVAPEYRRYRIGAAHVRGWDYRHKG